MSDPDVGALGKDYATGSLSDFSICDQQEHTTHYYYSVYTHAHDDEILKQSYNEVRENKQNTWHVQSHWDIPPKSPVGENDLYYDFATAESVEYWVHPAGDTAGTDRIDFDNPVPDDGDSSGVSRGFSLSASAGRFPGLSLGASFGYNFGASDVIDYQQSHNNEQHHSYWDIPLDSGLGTDPDSGDATGVTFDVQCFTPYDPNVSQYQDVGISSQCTFSYFLETGPACPPDYTMYLKTTAKTDAGSDFEVGPP